MTFTTIFGLTGKVEIAQGADPDGDPSLWTWTDVSTAVLNAGGIQITRGRTSDLNPNVDPMQCAFQVDNTAGDWTPGNPSGAYYPFMRKNLPVRVSLFNSSLSAYVTRFQGFVDELPVSFPTNRDSGLVTASVTASGRWRRIAQKPPLRSYMAETILNSQPFGFWPLTDSTLMSDISGNNLPDGLASGWTDFTYDYPEVNTLGVVSKPVGLAPDKLAVPQLTTGATFPLPGFSPSSTDGVAAMVFAADPLAAPLVDVVYMTLLDGTESVWTLEYAVSTNNWLVRRNGAVVQSAGRNTDAPMIVLWTHVDPTTINVKLGVFDIFGVNITAAIPMFTQIIVAKPTPDYAFSGVGYVAVWDHSLSVEQTERITKAPLGVAGGSEASGQFPVEQLSRLAGYRASTMLVEALDENTNYPGGLTPGGMNALDAIRQAASAQPGVVFEGIEGELVHQSIHHRLDSSAWLTLDMGDSDVLAGVQLSYDDRDVLNDATVKTINAAGTYTDQQSVTDNGKYHKDFQSPAFYRIDLGMPGMRPVDYAAYLVNLRGRPEVRLSNISVDMRAQTGLWGTWLRQQVRNRAWMQVDGWDDAGTETGMTGVTNCTVTLDSTSKAFTGADSSKVTVTATGVWVAEQFLFRLQKVMPGQVWTGSFYIRANAATVSVAATLRWYDGNLNLLSSSTGTSTTDTTSPVRRTVTGTAPANAAYVKIGVSGASASAGAIHFVSNRMLEMGSSASAYIDGNQTGCRWLNGSPAALGESYKDADPIGSLVRVQNVPAQMGRVDDVLHFVEGYTETISMDAWRVDMNFTPAGWLPFLFTVQDSTAGHLGCDGQSVNTTASAGATTVSVATAAGKPLLTTVSGNYPLDFIIDGRKVHATACSGSSSPQTLTVSALANALPAGSSVGLWQPYSLTL